MHLRTVNPTMMLSAAPRMVVRFLQNGATVVLVSRSSSVLSEAASWSMGGNMESSFPFMFTNVGGWSVDRY